MRRPLFAFGVFLALSLTAAFAFVPGRARPHAEPRGGAAGAGALVARAGALRLAARGRPARRRAALGSRPRQAPLVRSRRSAAPARGQRRAAGVRPRDPCAARPELRAKRSGRARSDHLAGGDAALAARHLDQPPRARLVPGARARRAGGALGGAPGRRAHGRRPAPLLRRAREESRDGGGSPRHRGRAGAGGPARESRRALRGGRAHARARALHRQRRWRARRPAPRSTG